MSISLPDILILLEQYKYALIFPVRIFEGPIITVISGFLVSLGFLNGPITYIMLVTADLIGDSLYYLVGRYFGNSRVARRIGLFLGFNEEREKRIEEHFRKHKGKTLFIAKLAHGIGGMAQMVSGIVRVNFFEFLWFNLLGSIPKTLIFFLIGFYLGNSYVKIDKYLSIITFVTIGIVIILILSYVFMRKFANRYFTNSG